jgi:hypothetical protein
LLLQRTSALSLTLLFIASFPDCALAAVCNAIDGPKHDFQFITGYSPTSSTWIGTPEDRRLVLAGLTYSYRCWSVRQVDISYTTGVLPVAVLLQPAMPDFRSLMPRIVRAHAVYGAAVLPIGFTAHFTRRAIRPFFETHGGIIASTEPVPINAPDATGLNFLFDFGPGIRFNIGDHHGISIGYKFLHISNASTTSFNPGVDNNVFFVGFSVLR